MTNRLFISLEIPEEPLQKLIETRDSIFGHDRRVKWEEKEKLHLTVKFLGDTEISMIEEIKFRLSKIAKKFSPIKSSFNNFGLFYRFDIPSILWCGIENCSDIKNLNCEIESEMQVLGFRPENRKFKPHITLLRVRKHYDFERIEMFNKYTPPEEKFVMKKLILFKSELAAGGSIHTCLEKFELQ